MPNTNVYFLRNDESRETLQPPSRIVIAVGWMLIVSTLLGIIFVLLTLRIPSTRVYAYSVIETIPLGEENRAVLAIEDEGSQMRVFKGVKFLEIQIKDTSGASAKMELLDLRVEKVSINKTQDRVELTVLDADRTLRLEQKGNMQIRIKNKTLISKLTSSHE